MDRLKKIETLFGVVVFLVAWMTYHLTVEPTASFWDCGEYIATSAKLQIGHPPGAPLFQMIGAFFAMFASSNEDIAYMVNYMSVLSSAFAILFLYLTTSNLLKKIFFKSDKCTVRDHIAVIGSSVVAALTLCFSDSFWFNAVEAEVYAMAMLLFSGLFWLGLKWVDHMNTDRGNKWLILISFVIGLSFGVHFMALLAIPAIGMLYYFKAHKKPSILSFIMANLLSICVLLFIFKLMLPYTLSFFGYLEVFFVNSFGLPFNSGTIIAAIFLIGAFVLTLRYTRKKQLFFQNTIVLCLMFILLGFSTWLMIPIRSNANTVINENSPSDARLLLAYYNLEQYPDSHLFYGPMFTDAYAGQDKDNPYMDDKPKYERDYDTGKYVVVNKWKNAQISPNSEHEGFLPRLRSTENAKNYMSIVGFVDVDLKSEYKDNDKLGEVLKTFKESLASGFVDVDDFMKFLKDFKPYIDVKKPTFFQNIYFLFKFQIKYMYMRYFMWNFVGRQDDVQGELNNHGNWLSGVDVIDQIYLGPQENLPSDVLNNKGRNTYFFLPLLLGLLGLFFHFKASSKQFWVLLILFAFSGLALKFYLNERAFEPRERDYALVGSFYVFAIWVGFGCSYLYKKISAYSKTKFTAVAMPLVCLLLVPVLMAFQNWDDHDRSDRYTAQSIAKAYLDSIQEDVGAMLFTIGDNDTFALWYAQEIEEYRTDIRTINTSLLATDWYIDQNRRKTYDSEPVPTIFEHNLYVYGTRDVVYYQELTENRWNIKDFVSWITSDDKKTKIELGNGQTVVYYPTHKIRVPVDKKNVLESGLVKPKDSALIVDYIDIDLPKSVLTKNRLLMLDILAQNDWKRPIYFTGGSFDKAEYIWMKEYLQLDGMVYKLVPIKTKEDKNNPYQMGRIDTDLMFDIVKKWTWGNSGSDKIYHDPETRKNSITYRSNLSRLALELIQEEKMDKAKEILDMAMDNLPIEFFGYYSLLSDFIKGYYLIGEVEKARAIYSLIAEKYRENIYYCSTLDLTQNSYQNLAVDVITNMERFRDLIDVIVDHDQDSDFVKEEVESFNDEITRMGYFYDEEDRYELEAIERDTLGFIK